MQIKKIFSSGLIKLKDEETGEIQAFYKCSAYVSGEIGFMHTFLSDRKIKVGDNVKLPEWVLSENIYVDKKGKIQIELRCEES